ncbi:MAG: chorismate synthase, partial [Clostridia bacterium]|nr:chorismate synthase [Clostridia bacterium]
ISLGTHILSCGGVQDRAFNNLQEDLTVLAERNFPVLDLASGRQMTEKILQARQEQDSLGGLTQTALCGLPAGLGEPWFDSLEGLLAHALFSLGGIKGIEFGLGFALAASRGSQSNDPFRVEKGRVITQTNHNGGINGGLSNGMPIIFQCAVKPTPSIGQEQKTIDFVKGENTTIAIEGRHDPAIVRRICPVIDSLTALVIADLLAQRFGTDVLRKGRKECNMD